MGIKDKQTYGEYYWAMQVEAQDAYDENIESALAPFFAGMFAEIPELSELPAGMLPFVQSLAEPPSAGFGGFALGVGVETIDELLHTAMQPMMKMMARKLNKRSRETWLTSAEANTLFRRGKIEKDLWESTVASEGYEDILGKFLYLSQIPYPTISDIMLWARYHGDAINTREKVWDKQDIPAEDYEMYEWLTLMRLSTLQVQALYKRGFFSESDFYESLERIGWRNNDINGIRELSYSLPNAMLLVQGGLLEGVGTEELLADVSRADIHPDYAQKYLNAILTKPASTDLVAYHLRKDPTLAELETDLRKVGIHPEYTDIYKTLAYSIPPVADIITMAVREAFTPDIAERFGQYEDFPDELEKWGEKKGLSAEWTKRYWAAHWSLPSPTQGFDMLHRGLITQDELNMLLRALDVMPFWRDKLVGIAYRKLSRVDIRRMYRVGVLNESEVLEAYSELGYNDRDARRMTEFTIKQVLATQSKFTAGNIVAAYSKYMIDRAEARDLLGAVGVRSENISFVLTSAEYKRSWELTDSRISAIHNLYRKKVYDDDTARASLLKLNLPSNRVDVLMEQWYIGLKDVPVRFWTTAQVLSFVKDGTITYKRGKQELIALGYDAEHIDAYMKGL